MGGEGHEPVHHKIVGPDQENQDIDGQDPQHENEDRVGVIAEIEVRGGSLLKKLERPMLARGLDKENIRSP